MTQPMSGADAFEPLSSDDPVVVGPYRIVGRLGAGGMGVVYLGRSAAGRLVAVKMIRAEFAADEEFRRRFTREVAAARTVPAVYTAPVIDADPDADAPWLATAYVAGPSLQKQVREYGPLGVHVVLSLALGLAEALSAIHRTALIHRDVKPGNVLLTDAGPQVIDFGIALLTDQTRLTGGIVVGTPAFAAPERIGAGVESPAGDIFSLGATLVYAATGHGPVAEAGGIVTHVARIARGQLDLDDVPRALKPLVVRCVSRNPADRPTADELVKILAGSGVAAPTAGWLLLDEDMAPARLTGMGWPRRRLLTTVGLGAGVGLAAAAGTALAMRKFPALSNQAQPSPSSSLDAPHVAWHLKNASLVAGTGPSLIAQLHDSGQFVLLNPADGGILTRLPSLDGPLNRREAEGVLVHVRPDDSSEERFTTEAVDLETGEVLFSFETQNLHWSVAQFHAHAGMLVWSAPDVLTGRDLRTGSIKWQKSLGTELTWTRYVGADAAPIFFTHRTWGTPEVHASARNIDTGDVIWQVPSPNEGGLEVWTVAGRNCLRYIEVAPWADDNAVTFKLEARNAHSSDLMWDMELGDELVPLAEGIVTFPVMGDYVLYRRRGSPNDQIVAISLKTGDTVWSVPVPFHASSAVFSNGAIYYIDSRATQLVSAPVDIGKTGWRYDLPRDFDIAFNPFASRREATSTSALVFLHGPQSDVPEILAIADPSAEI